MKIFLQFHLGLVVQCMRGVLDSGANITVLGNGSEKFIENAGVRFYHQPTVLSTASGEAQRIIGHKRALVTFSGK